MKVQLQSFLNRGSRCAWAVSATPRSLYLRKATRYLLYRRLSGLQDRSGRVRSISPPPVFDPWPVQPVAIRETDWAIAALLRREDSSTMDITDVSLVALTLMYLVLDKVRWQAVAHKVTNLKVPQEASKFSSGWLNMSSC